MFPVGGTPDFYRHHKNVVKKIHKPKKLRTKKVSHKNILNHKNIFNIFRRKKLAPVVTLVDNTPSAPTLESMRSIMNLHDYFGYYKLSNKN
jgi:hypothetical protein